MSYNVVSLKNVLFEMHSKTLVITTIIVLILTLQEL